MSTQTNMQDGWEAVIGLEIHAQVLAPLKLFSDASTSFGAKQNSNITLFDVAYPGLLPTINTFCVEQAVRTALGLDATVSLTSRFDRKNYFYQDLPKGYQITQFYNPIALDGSLEIEEENGGSRLIRIERIHMEEDAGKSIHCSIMEEAAEKSIHCSIEEQVTAAHTLNNSDSYSYQDEKLDRLGNCLKQNCASTSVSLDKTFIDLNRAGICLMEIVTAPDMHSSFEVMAFLRKLRGILRALQTCDGDMEKGSMRCDANVSVKRVTDSQLGVRSEIKNLNSIRNVGRAVDYEIQRQIDVLRNSGVLSRETRSFDVESGTTALLRSKEDATDYCYFPDPDLPPLLLTNEYVDIIRTSLPELPEAKKERYISTLKLAPVDAEIIAYDALVAEFFETVLAFYKENTESTSDREVIDYDVLGVDSGTRVSAKMVANWIIVELFSYLNSNNISINKSSITPRNFAELLLLISGGVISGKIAKSVFEAMCVDNVAPIDIVKRENLRQVSDEEAILRMVNDVLALFPGEVARYKAGARKLLGFFIGEVMKKSNGTVNPEVCKKLVENALSGVL